MLLARDSVLRYFRQSQEAASPRVFAWQQAPSSSEQEQAEGHDGAGDNDDEKEPDAKGTGTSEPGTDSTTTTGAGVGLSVRERRKALFATGKHTVKTLEADTRLELPGLCMCGRLYRSSL